MALLTSHSDANKQVLEPARTWTEVIGFRTSAYLIRYRIETTYSAEKYKYVGMTQAAALACYAEVNSPSTGIKACVRWVDGTMFEVEVDKLLAETVEISI